MRQLSKFRKTRGQQMAETNPLSLQPFGQALFDYWHGNKSALLIHEFRSGRKRSLPVSVFFRGADDFFPTEDAFCYCRGRILVVGAGTGVHALELERRGHEVTAIDICPQAVQIMKERGIKNIRQQNFMTFEEDAYDTILMLGHNIGICETVKGIKRLLCRCKSLLRPDGRLLVNSVDESQLSDAPNHEGYPGELEFRLCYNGNAGPWMRWLHADFDTLALHAEECGWASEKLIDSQDGAFLAKLKPGG